MEKIGIWLVVLFIGYVLQMIIFELYSKKMEKDRKKMIEALQQFYSFINENDLIHDYFKYLEEKNDIQ